MTIVNEPMYLAFLRNIILNKNFNYIYGQIIQKTMKVKIMNRKDKQERVTIASFNKISQKNVITHKMTEIIISFNKNFSELFKLPIILFPLKIAKISFVKKLLTST